MPNSPLRGTALTCLDVYDQAAFTAEWHWDGTNGQREAAQNAWRDACDRLGFGGKATTVYVPLQDGSQQRVSRFVSARLRFSLKDMQELVPGVLKGDLLDMDPEQIAVRAVPAAEMPEKWEQFVREVLAREAVGVWTPTVNPFARPWDQAQSFEQFHRARLDEEAGNPLITRRGLGSASQIRHTLDSASYRTNALIPFYVDEASALADGWRASEIEQVDLPYALPLWASKTGQIQAIQDIRFLPELMDADPIQYLGDLKKGVIVGAIREAAEIGQSVRRHMGQWAGWAANPATLDMPDLLWGSLTEVAGAHADLCERYPTVVTSGLSDLSDGKEADRRGQFRAKPLADMTAGTMYWMSRLCARYASLGDEEVALLQAILEKTLARGHALLGEHIQALAVQELEELSQSVKQLPKSSPDELEADAANTTDRPKFRHEDAGEKIGGARKDFARRAMVADDLEVMNDAERDLFVVKKNIWASLDYAAMRADGVEAEAALGIKVVKDKLLGAPTRDRGAANPDAEYIEAIAMVRDRFAGVKTLDDFRAACQELFTIGNQDHDGKPTNTIFGMPIQVQWGSKACDIFFSGSEGYTPALVGREISRKVRVYGREATEDEKWRSMIKAKVEKTQEQRDEERAKVDMDRDLHRPHLARVERIGENWRGGRDIVADDLIEHFGFRGVEFGNWLPQDERQQVLNMAFDSLCDLAAALKLPPKGLSLDGSLAVAFGSRGSGGKSAALAHYESSRTVINLTRMNGAGSLAHEWMHAYDDHLGGGRGFSSEVHAGGTAMSNLSGRMRRRLALADEILEMADENARKGLEYTRSWLFGQPQEVRDKLGNMLQAEYDRLEAVLYDEARRHIEATSARPDYEQNGFGESGAVTFSRSFELAELLVSKVRENSESKTAFTKVKGKVEANLRFMMDNLVKVVSVRAARDLGVELPATFRGRSNCRPSNFFKEAEKLDSTRSSPYWATTRELFARAGAAYVCDKIEAAGGRSDYLVFGADEGRYADHEIGNPNPTGEDRQELAECFDALIAEYRLTCVKETEQEALAEP